MNPSSRRDFLSRTACGAFAAIVSRNLEASSLATALPDDNASAALLPGTAPLTMQGDLAWEMVEGMHRYLLRRIDDAAKERFALWTRDNKSKEAYERSISPNRERFRRIIGAVDARVEVPTFEVLSSVSAPGDIAQGQGYRVDAVSWRTLAPVVADFGGVDAEGLLLQPLVPPVARIVAIPDADWTPEMLVGLAAGVPPAAQFARHLAENGCQVLVPLIINRDDTFSGIPGVRMTNQTHREWIYRAAFEMGRHIIGYEVQKILAAVDWFSAENSSAPLPIGVMGYGEGGLLALYSAALDARIQAAAISGYFQEREQLWKEPIYRDVWGLLLEFGDAEIASLIAPRGLIIEACRGPEAPVAPPVTDEHARAACPNGVLVSPPLNSVQREANRAREFYRSLGAEDRLQVVVSGDGQGAPGTEAALKAFCATLGVTKKFRSAGPPPHSLRQNYEPLPRLRRQFDQMVGFTQALVRKAPDRLEEFWSKADRSSVKSWKQTTPYYRNYFWEEVLGRLPASRGPFNARTRQVYDTPKFIGYEVVLDVCPDVIDYGILLLPKDIKAGERRPTVVCQHGVEGRPTDVADPNDDVPKENVAIYHRFAVRLAEMGFVTYAPQNPYQGGDHFRILHHMGHPVKLAIYSFILAQHEQLLDWLASQPFVDPQRIGFYGLSYGGRTAVHVPPLLERYALSICSADFNENTWKTTNVLNKYSYMILGTYDAYYFDAGNVANYGELATLMAPRPFMVERGHNDTVSIDEWVSHEYAKVRRLYEKLGIGDHTEIEFFNGLHEIHGVGTIEFLRRHLNWPA